MRRTPSFVGLAVTVGLAAVGAGCHGSSDAARRQAAEVTSAAEDKAQQARLTSAALDDEAEMIAAFRLERADYRGRLQVSLDRLDKAVLRRRQGASTTEASVGYLRARRDLLKSDLEAVRRSTEQDWATLRTKVERDLETGRLGAQAPQRAE